MRGKLKTRPAFQARSQADPGDQAQQASELSDSLRAAKWDRKELKVVPGPPGLLIQTSPLWAELLSHRAESKLPPSLAPWLELQQCQPASVGLLPGAAALPFVTQEVGRSGATSWRSEIDQEGLTLKMLTWGTSLVVQWLRISQPIQGTQVRPTV